ncbi:MAG TPA: DUF721 domain-containing protein [Planctomycetaceae bacterium]|nr:DUF721 domain-containing protein [Planctomycetaceae bacterium]
MERRRGPIHVSQALSELIVRRGWSRSAGDRQLQEVWEEAAGAKLSQRTRVLGMRDGVLRVGVAHAALLSELESFHKRDILKRIRAVRPDFRIRDLKFLLRGEMTAR